MHGNSRVKISRSFDFDAARYNGVFRGIFGEGGGRGGKGLVLEEPGFNKIRDMHRSPLRTYIYIYAYTQPRVYTDTGDGMESWSISVCTLRHRPIIISI